MINKSVTLLLLPIILTGGCNFAGRIDKRENAKFPEVQNLAAYPHTDFVPTLEHPIQKGRNSVYCVTLLYAWDEIRQLLKQPIDISLEYRDLFLVNHSESFQSVLEEGEYEASGIIDGDWIKVRAEFAKTLPFPVKLTSYTGKLNFDQVPVASFGTDGYPWEQLRVAKIAYFKDHKNFVVKLLPKDKEHEIILFMTDSPSPTMGDMVKEITSLIKLGSEERKMEKHYWKYRWNDEDILVVPKFSFNIESHYENIEGADFTAGNRSYDVQTAWQRTAFMLDESGADLESEAEVAVTEEIEEDLPIPKRMIFDRPFLLIMKRKEAANPYFAMWISHPELLVKE